MQRERSGIIAGAVWMTIITLALFFLPLINGLVGGAVGGYKTGGVKPALTAAILPAIVVAGGLWLLFALFGAPAWGVLAGAAVGLLVLLADIGIFLGAAIGGWWSQSRRGSRHRPATT